MLGSERMIVGARPCHVRDLKKDGLTVAWLSPYLARNRLSSALPLFSHTATRNSAMSAVVRPTHDMHAAPAHRTRAAMHAIAHTMTRTSDSAAHPSSPDQPTAAISNRSHVHARPPRLSVCVCVLVHAPGKQEKPSSTLEFSFHLSRCTVYCLSFSQPRSVRNIITHVRPMYAFVPSS